MQQLSQSVCIGVTLSFGWLGKLSREAANRVLFRYLYYLLYLVPEVPVVPVAHKNLISAQY